MPSIGDNCPLSSRYVRAMLLGAGLTGAEFAEIRTWANGDGQAETYVQRWRSNHIDHEQTDREVIEVLAALPGSTKAATIELGRHFGIVWDGIRRPA